MIKTSEFIEQYRQGKVPASTLVKMAAFKDELEKAIAKDGLEKIAVPVPGNPGFWAKFMGKLPNFSKSTAELGKTLGIAGEHPNPINQALFGGLVLGGSVMAVQEIVKSIEGKIIDWKNDWQKPKKFQEMLALHPELKEKEDRTKVYFEALSHFSPMMIENPLSAGAWIKQALQYDHVAQGPLPQTISELTMIEKNIAQADKDSKGDSLMTTIMTPFNASVRGK